MEKYTEQMSGILKFLLLDENENEKDGETDSN